MITYQLENYNDVIDELTPYLADHYEEVAMYKDFIELEPDFQKYCAASEAGTLCMYIMRDGDKLVGYNIFFLVDHMHYKSHRFAMNDIVYIDPEYRHNIYTYEFFTWCEEQLADKDVSVMTYHMKEMHSFHSLMKTLDQDHAEHLYTKYIGK